MCDQPIQGSMHASSMFTMQCQRMGFLEGHEFEKKPECIYAYAYHADLNEWVS